MEGIASLSDTRSFSGQQPGGEEFSFEGLIAETDLPPLDGGAQSSFRRIVGWLDTAVFEKGEQPMPVSEEAFCRLGHIVVGAGGVNLEASAHATSYGHGFSDEHLPVQMVVLEGMPHGEHSACLGEHPRGESHGVRTSAGMFDSLDGSDDVGPAELSETIVKRLVRGVHVRTEDSPVCPAQNLSEDLCSPRCGHMEVLDAGSDHNPQPSTFPVRFPSSLVDVELRLLRQSLPCFGAGRGQGFRNLLMKLADRSQADVYSEDGLGDFLAAPTSYAVQTRQMSKQCGKPGAKT